MMPPVLALSTTPGRAVGGGEFIQHGLHALFQIVLDGGVQRQRQVAAVLGGKILLVGIEHIVLRLVFGGDHQSALPLQLLLVVGLQPYRPVFSVPTKPMTWAASEP